MGIIFSFSIPRPIPLNSFSFCFLLHLLLLFSWLNYCNLSFLCCSAFFCFFFLCFSSAAISSFRLYGESVSILACDTSLLPRLTRAAFGVGIRFLIVTARTFDSGDLDDGCWMVMISCCCSLPAAASGTDVVDDGDGSATSTLAGCIAGELKKCV